MTMRNAQKPHNGADQPTHTITAGGAGLSLVAAFLAQHNGGERMEAHAGRPADAPVSTITCRATQQNVVAAHLINMKGSDRRASAADEPMRTITAQGGGPGVVAAFMAKYYGQGEGQAADEPLHTITTRDRFGLVAVQIGGEPRVIVDIGMRMLTPRELFAAQGFPVSYQIDQDADGVPFTKSVQTRCVGNSVCPPIAEAIVRANVTLRDVETPESAPASAPLFEGGGGVSNEQKPITGAKASTLDELLFCVQQPGFRLGFLDAQDGRPFDHENIMQRIWNETPEKALRRLNFPTRGRWVSPTEVEQQQYRYEEGREAQIAFGLTCRGWGHPDYPPKCIIELCLRLAEERRAA